MRTFLLILSFATALSAEPAQYSWMPGASSEPLETRFAPPGGFRRVPAEQGSFAEWLRRLPLKRGRPEVLLYNGQPKRNQTAHAAVVDMPISKKDLHQCADALMHLRAEYLFHRGNKEQIVFHSTSGDLLPFSKWQSGQRPQVQGNRIRWTQSRPADGSYQSLSRYLEFVYTYSGTISLVSDTKKVSFGELRIGDLFLQSGSPGHAVIVVDKAEKSGTTAFLLAQSYMPAQELHVLRNPQGGEWYHSDRIDRELVTPEWTFARDSLRRFPPY
ncbi:MAG: DUF4846 domain-containing protein [Leptospirales bacterium]|nr:DUF4846 domain-containing protein [Leptospirales bacterium]